MISPRILTDGPIRARSADRLGALGLRSTGGLDGADGWGDGGSDSLCCHTAGCAPLFEAELVNRPFTVLDPRRQVKLTNASLPDLTYARFAPYNFDHGSSLLDGETEADSRLHR